MLNYFYDGSTIGHINAVSNTFVQSLSLFGNGISQFGISGKLGTESFYISIIGQIGFVGLLLYILIILSTLYHVHIISSKKMTKLVTLLCISYVLTGFLSEQLGAFTTIFPVFVSFGFLSYNFNAEGSINNTKMKGKHIYEKYYY